MLSPQNAANLSATQQVQQCIHMLATDDEKALLWSCSQLAALLSDERLTADGMSYYCTLMQSDHCIERLCTLVSHPSKDVHARALHILGNVAADPGNSVRETKRIIRQAGGVQAVLSHLNSPDATTIFYAMGTAMNLCTTAADVRIAHSVGCFPRIMELSHATQQPQLAQFAEACLRNMQVAIGSAQANRAQDGQARAAVSVQAAFRGRLARRQAARAYRAALPNSSDIDERREDQAALIQAAVLAANKHEEGMPPKPEAVQLMTASSATAGAVASVGSEKAASTPKPEVVQLITASSATAAAVASIGSEKAVSTVAVENNASPAASTPVHTAAAVAPTSSLAATQSTVTDSTTGSSSNDSGPSPRPSWRGALAKVPLWRRNFGQNSPKAAAPSSAQLPLAGRKVQPPPVSKEKEANAAMKVQARARGQVARKETASKREAVVAVQSGARGKLARNEAAGRRQAAVKVQSGVRGKLARNETKAKAQCALDLTGVDLSSTAAILAKLNELGIAPASEGQQKKLSLKFNERLMYMVDKGDSLTWTTAFKSVDANDSGLINFDEFNIVIRQKLRMRRADLSTIDIMALWVALDTDQKRQISSAEFYRFMHLAAKEKRTHQSNPADSLVLRRQAAQAKMADQEAEAKKRAGYLTKTTEMRDHLAEHGVPPSSEEQQKKLSLKFNERLDVLNIGRAGARTWLTLFKDIDTNDGGTITYDEFTSVLRQKLKISKVDLPNVNLMALWVALDADAGDQISSTEFGRFMKLATQESTQESSALDAKPTTKARQTSSAAAARKSAAVATSKEDAAATVLQSKQRGRSARRQVGQRKAGARLEAHMMNKALGRGTQPAVSKPRASAHSHGSGGSTIESEPSHQLSNAPSAEQAEALRKQLQESLSLTAQALRERDEWRAKFAEADAALRARPQPSLPLVSASATTPDRYRAAPMLPSASAPTSPRSPRVRAAVPVYERVGDIFDQRAQLVRPAMVELLQLPLEQLQGVESVRSRHYRQPPSRQRDSNDSLLSKRSAAPAGLTWRAAPRVAASTLQLPAPVAAHHLALTAYTRSPRRPKRAPLDTRLRVPSEVRLIQAEAAGKTSASRLLSRPELQVDNFAIGVRHYASMPVWQQQLVQARLSGEPAQLAVSDHADQALQGMPDWQQQLVRARLGGEPAQLAVSDHADQAAPAVY